MVGYLTEGHISRRGALIGTASPLALNACSNILIPPASSVTRAADLDGLPYHPVPLHLDLCILSYQLYAQSLVWPFDPYYERYGSDAAREAQMDRVRSWVASTDQTDPGPANGGYRGPGSLAGFDNNSQHEPIVYRYDTLRPWNAALSLAEVNWIEQETPPAIARQISDVFMCYRPSGSAADATRIDPVARAGGSAASGARDQLFAFEGDTGDKGEPGQPASQSMMGFVLKRQFFDSGDYDIHIVFRGSRSGNSLRTARQALSRTEARGNPDWITDLGYDFIGSEEGAGDISTIGKLHRGFVQSVRSMLPKIIACSSRIADQSEGRPPRRIFLTGHSLGGGLAIQLSSAVLLGDRFGPDGEGPDMPRSLRNWPWTALKLITFGGPVSGDQQWAEALTSGKLQSRFFEKAAWGTTLTDPDGIAVNAPEIVLRLADRTRPAAYRVLNPADPITSLRLLGGKHVGQTVYVAPTKRLGFVDPAAHEPLDIRARIQTALNDPSVPQTGWRYRKLNELSPESDLDNAGDPEEFDKLIGAILRYYQTHTIPFDQARLKRDYAVFRKIQSEE